mgnify:CR=1 FL=1
MNHTEIPDKNMVSDNYRRIGDRYVYLYDSESFIIDKVATLSL